MKFLIVFSLLFIAAAYANSDDELVERLLKRHEEQLERKRSLQSECHTEVSVLFADFVYEKDEPGNAEGDIARMVEACVNAGGPSHSTPRLTVCIETRVAAVSKRSHMFTRIAGNCALAAPSLNDLIAGDAASEDKIEQICVSNGGVHYTIQDLAQCVENTPTPA